MKIREAVSRSAEIISRRWPETPFLDAQVMLQHCCGIAREKLLADYNEEIDPGLLQRLEKMVEKRVSGYPVAYITGKKEFYGRVFSVDERVLIPRCDTEVLVEKALLEAQKLYCAGKKPVRILDLCTGSGCLAITLKCELGSRASITASDISSGAEEVFGVNCSSLAGGNITFMPGNLFEPFVPGKDIFDIIVSNPPYLTRSHVDEMKSAAWPEPDLALLGGEDGLELVRKIADKAVDFLDDTGMLCMEADPEQMVSIAAMLTEAGFSRLSIEKDLAGRERVISGWRK